MPPRGDADREQRRQQIIDGALEVFAKKGFENATNKDIASAAGIGSAGLIYHYFADKADLFRQVVEQRAPALQLLMHSEELMDLPPRQVLRQLGDAFIHTVENRATVAVVRVMLGEALRRPSVAQMINTIGPTRVFNFLTRYLEYQMDKGTLRRVDPSAAARCLVGSMVGFMVAREVFPQPDSPSLSAATMVETAIDLFLQGLEL